MTFSLPSNPGKAKRPAKSDFSVHIGQKLYKLRKQHRMTQQTLAGHLGVTYQQLQKYESGDNRIPVESLVILQQLFHVPYDYFFDIGKSKKATQKQEDLRLSSYLYKSIQSVKLPKQRKKSSKLLISCVPDFSSYDKMPEKE